MVTFKFSKNWEKINVEEGHHIFYFINQFKLYDHFLW